MAQVTIVKPFMLLKSDGSFERFNPGVHEVDDETAAHWYVVAHSDKAPPVEPPPGTPEYGQKRLMEKREAEIARVVEKQKAEAARLEAVAAARGKPFDMKTLAVQPPAETPAQPEVAKT